MDFKLTYKLIMIKKPYKNRTEESYFKDSLHNYMRAAEKLFNKIVSTSKNVELQKLNRSVKQEGPTKGQYGYYITHSSLIIHIAAIMKLLKCYSICDLGAGAGIIISVLNDFYGIIVGGYEIEDSLIDIAHEYFPNGRVYKKDLLTLTNQDLNSFDCLYFWEPFHDPKLSKQFVDILEKACNRKQYIIYNSSGKIGEYLDQSDQFTRIEAFDGRLRVYQKN